MNSISISKDIEPLSEFRKKSADFIKRLKKEKQPIILTQHGKSTAVLMDVTEYEQASFDFNVGYSTAIFTAICFVAMGAYVMFANNVPLEEDATGFATQLMDLFTSTIGAWVYPIIAIAAVTVMFSTLLTLMDLLPRTSAEIISRLAPQTFGTRRVGLYLAFIALEFFLVLSVLLLLMESFTTFIELVTSMGFIVAPVIALLNHLAIFSNLVPKELQPGRTLKVWSWVTIITLTAVAVLFVVLRY